jgi:serine/threonine-protein kinase ULK/ATG1
MAPEIWQGKDYDAKVGSLYSIKFMDLFIWKGWTMNSAWNVLQSDLWSVGVILFQLVTGKLPYTGSTYFQVCYS